MLARLLARSAASFDRVIGHAMTYRSSDARSKSRSESLGHADRMVRLAEIERLYAGPAGDPNVDHFFGVPQAFSVDGRVVGKRSSKRGDVDVVDVRWPSRTDPFCAELASSFKAVHENREGAARFFLGRESGRPAMILVHGYRGGSYRVGERVWPIAWLLDHGMDVAQVVLPFHSLRAAPRSAPRFPGSDPRFTNEGFRQAIGDLRDVVATFHARGSREVGAMGMSLGGYTVGLLATVEPLAFVAPIIPLASFGDIALASGRLVGSPDEQLAQRDALEASHAVVSPFTRKSLVPKERAMVVGGEGDRITPIAHAQKLAAHLQADLVVFPGGHILQFGRSAGFRAIGERLRSVGIFRA